jgi:hypothetical protein
MYYDIITYSNNLHEFQSEYGCGCSSYVFSYTVDGDSDNICIGDMYYRKSDTSINIGLLCVIY